MKKWISILLVFILMIDFTSCDTYKQLSTVQDFEKYQEKKNVKVLVIHLKKDSLIIFSEKFPGKIANNHVYGLPQIHFPFNQSDSVIFTSTGNRSAYIKSKGTHYLIVSQDKSGFYCLVPDTIQTKFTDVALMKVKKKDSLKTTLLFIGIGTIIVILTGYIISTDLNINGGFTI